MENSFKDDLAAWKKGYFSAKFDRPRNTYINEKQRKLFALGLEKGLRDRKGKNNRPKKRKMRVLGNSRCATGQTA